MEEIQTATHPGQGPSNMSQMEVLCTRDGQLANTASNQCPALCLGLLKRSHRQLLSSAAAALLLLLGVQSPCPHCMQQMQLKPCHTAASANGGVKGSHTSVHAGTYCRGGVLHSADGWLAHWEGGE
jgi:hypothetical protein